jgi:hypothetical protein
MQKYGHKYLSDEEKNDFVELFKDNVKNNPLVTLTFKYPIVAIIFPLIIIALLYFTIINCTNIFITLIFSALGILSIQLTFIMSHMWAHALMLEYDLWNVDGIPKLFGQIPSVIFYAFYHHHHKPGDFWMRAPLGHSVKMDSFATAFTHWESFSLFTQNYPFNHIFLKLYLIYNLMYNPISIPFILGYEIGVFLLPISHDWVHERKSGAFGTNYFLKPLEMIGIFATKEEHKRHHEVNHRTVYQGFTSSGLYSKRFDGIVDNVWNYVHDKYGKFEYGMCEVFYWLFMIVFTFVLLVPLATGCFIY